MIFCILQLKHLNYPNKGPKYCCYFLNLNVDDWGPGRHQTLGPVWPPQAQTHPRHTDIQMKHPRDKYHLISELPIS